MAGCFAGLEHLDDVALRIEGSRIERCGKNSMREMD